MTSRSAELVNLSFGLGPINPNLRLADFAEHKLVNYTRWSPADIAVFVSLLLD